MKTASLALVLSLMFHLVATAQSVGPKELAGLWETNHISRISPSNVRYSDLKIYLNELQQLGLKVDEVGRSYADREIHQIEWGVGPTKVFLWSQMHGDEPTATSAMLDLLAYLQQHPSDDWVKALRESLSIRFVPMLNPDGAEFYQRRNLQGIDINRDATDLKTPEGRLLKSLRDEWQPVIGFNLHNQGALTTAGNTPRQAAISFLAVLGDPKGLSNAGFEKNQRIIAAMVAALKEFIPENMGRYDPSYNGLAFGDNFSAWGTPVILIETGALHGRDELYLVKMNFVALATAIQVIANGTDAKFDSALYTQLPLNASGKLMDVIFRKAKVIGRNGTGKYSTTDIGINCERRRASFSPPTVIRDIGDLKAKTGLVEYDASDFFVLHRFNKVDTGQSGEILFYKRSRRLDWRSTDFESIHQPDAVFSLGDWTQGAELMKQRIINGNAPRPK